MYDGEDAVIRPGKNRERPWNLSGYDIAMPRGSPMNGPEARADIQEDVHLVYSMLGDCKATRQLGVEES